MGMRVGRVGLLAAVLFGLVAGRAAPAQAGEDVCPEPNDTPESACPIGGNSSAAGYLNSPSDVDLYRIEVGEGQAVQASLGTLPGNYTLRLHTADGGAVAEATGGGNEDRALGANGLSGGPYFLAVSSAGGESSADQAYTLRVSVQGSVAGAVRTVDPNAPPPPPSPTRPLEQLVLIGNEAGERSKPSGKLKSGSENGASYYEVTFKRDNSDARYGPLITVNRVYRAPDVGTAQQLFNQQAGAGMPEAKALNLGVNSMGPQGIAPVGEEASALGACEQKNCTPDKELVTRHYRIVFRMGTLVETLYTYGPESGNNVNVATGLAKEIEKRINTPPEGPPPEIVARRAPGEIGLRIGDAGQQAVTTLDRTGSDGRSAWYEARFERSDDTIQQKLGPTHIYNKVFVANTNDDARAIFQENAVFDLPEATRERGTIFEEPKTKRFGNDSDAVGACNDDCGGTQSYLLHERLVFRWGNVVAIVYTWGREDQSNPDTLGTFAAQIMGRIY